VGRFSMLPGLRRAFADPDIAIDLGTANTRVYALGRGLIADEPSVIRVRPGTGSVEAVGARAVRLTPGGHDDGSAVSPLRAGVIEDVGAAASLLTPLFRRARRLGIVRPRVLACAPTDACDDDREAIVEAACRAGAGSVRIVPEPLAAAIGAGLDVASPYAQLLVDMGDGVTDIAVICSGSVIASAAVRTACSDLHTAVRRAVVDSHGALLYPDEAERLTRTAGVARDGAPTKRLSAVGSDCRTGREIDIVVTSREISSAIDPMVATIVRAVRDTVSDLPTGTSCEVIESGISLTGGGARLPGLAARLAAETSLDVAPAADPLRAVIDGARQMLTIGGLTGLWAN
jgi:rod shape-determining protein MreB